VEYRRRAPIGAYPGAHPARPGRIGENALGQRLRGTRAIGDGTRRREGALKQASASGMLTRAGASVGADHLGDRPGFVAMLAEGVGRYLAAARRAANARRG